MRRTGWTVSAALVVVAAGMPVPAAAQGSRGWGRVSFTAQSMSGSEGGERLPSFSELVTSVTVVSPTADTGGFEYRFDVRAAAYPQTENRDSRLSTYDAWVARRFAAGRLHVRVGQMWLNDLGGLGSLGGALVEANRPRALGFERVRVGAFAGLEPKTLELGYVEHLTKAGAYVAFEGMGSRRHVVGFVALRNSRLIERAVLTTTNYLPLERRVFVYQAAEIDLAGPGGSGSGGLTYFFTNARVTPVPALDIQGTFHRGRSIDARQITLDQLNGRAVSPRALEGFLYQSAGVRVTVTLYKNVRVFAGYARDVNNRDDAATTRTTVGVWTSNLFGTGLDVRASQSRMHGPLADYDAWDASVGRSLGPRLYLTTDYSSSLSVFRFSGADQYILQMRPRAQRFGATANVHLTRRFSLLCSADRTSDGSLEELRLLAGLTVRF